MPKKIASLLVALVIVVAPFAALQAQDNKAATQLPDAAAITAKLTKTRAAIVQGENQLLKADANQAASLRHVLAQQRKLEMAYQSQLAALKRGESLKQDAALQQELLNVDFKRQLAKPPYNLSDYDRLLDERDACMQQQKAVQTSLAIEASAIDEALAQTEKDRQVLRAAKDGAGDVQAANLDLDLATASLDRHRIAKANAQVELKLTTDKASLASRKAEWAGQHLVYDAADLRLKLSGIAARRDALLRQQDALSESLVRLEKEWSATQERVARENDNPAGEDALVKDFDLRRQACMNASRQVESRLQFLNQSEAIWHHRYALLKKRPPRATLQQWNAELETFRSGLQRQSELVLAEQQALQPQLASLNQDLGLPGLNDGARAHGANSIKALSAQVNRGVEYMVALKTAQTLAARFGDELAIERRHLRPGEMLALGWTTASKIWQTELWAIDEHPVTVSKVVIALIILVVGVIFAKRLLRRVIKRLESSTSMSKNSISIVSNAVYYFTLLVVVLFTLKTVRIPLTAFTFLGGALAIGVGFGAQNLLSNFISGFIIMMEQPIRIGDQVEVEGKVGVIKEIGARCTRVQTFENIDILVPNSVFLEKSIVNRSKADKLYRARVAVGVAYGSDTRAVEKLLNEVARSHPLVLSDPEPFVLFQAFGASTLDFELFVWLKLDDVGKVPSELRHRIGESFASQGIEIAFNQLDVHLKN